MPEEAISRLEMPVRLTRGSESPPVFPRVIDRLMELILWVTRETIEGAAHAPQLTTPERYVEITTRGVRSRVRKTPAVGGATWRTMSEGDGEPVVPASPHSGEKFPEIREARRRV